MLAPNFGEFRSQVTPPLYPSPDFSPQSLSRSAFPARRRIAHRSGHAETPATPFPSCACALFPSHVGVPVQINPRRSARTQLPTRPLVSPFLATLTGTAQLHENKTTLSLVFATLARLVAHSPFVCHSYEKHPGSHLSSQRSFRSGFSRPNFLPTRHSPLATKLLRIRTYEKRACNSRRIRTSKTQDLKPFRIRTYEKNRGGGVHRNAYSSSTIPASFRGLHER
jgi:hypothetical protein